MIPGQLLISYGRNDTGDATASLSGVDQEGQVKTCTFNDNDPDGPATDITFQWFRGASTQISGATSSTYTLVQADVGNTVKCRVNYTDGKGFPESIFTPNSGTIVDVIPGSTTYNSGSGTHVIQPYNTMRVEVWGPGAGGSAGNGLLGAPLHAATTSASSVGLGLVANGGSPGSGSTNPATGGAGGTWSGGAAGSNGSAGGNGLGPQGAAAASGAGGQGAAGGGGGASVTHPASSTGSTAGNSGSAPGGGGSGASHYSLFSSQGVGYPGGGGGAFTVKDYTLGAPGAPAVGQGISYSVGAGGAGRVGGGGTASGGSGANGRVRFTVLS